MLLRSIWESVTPLYMDYVISLRRAHYSQGNLPITWKLLTKKYISTQCTLDGTKYSRMDQVKFMEVFKKFEVIWSA